MIHDQGWRKARGEFQLTTFSSYDAPVANFSVASDYGSFSGFECLVERLSQTDEDLVTETGSWEACVSPFDLSRASGIDVAEGFNGQVRVRTLSASGKVLDEMIKPFRRAVWARGFDGWVQKVSGDEELFAGGGFTGMKASLSWDPVGIAQLNADGSPDMTIREFLSGISGIVDDIEIQTDGKILVAGLINGYNGITVPENLFRLNADGSVDSTFSGITSGFNGRVRVIKLLGDGSLLVGGNFTSYNGNASAPDRLIKLGSSGSVDTTFTGITSGFNGEVYDLQVQEDGKIIVGGSFSSYNGSGAAPDQLIRLNSDGSVDAAFTGITSGFNDRVDAITLQDDGKILVGGLFTSYNGSGAAPDRLIRLSANGSVDATFSGLTSGFDSVVEAISVQDDGKIVVGGWFTSYNGNASAPDRLIRLNVDGSVDATFTGVTTGIDDNYVHFVSVDSVGKIWVGGTFTSFNGSKEVSKNFIRLNADGSLDKSLPGLVTGFEGYVKTIAIGSNGKILVGGFFDSYNAGIAGPNRFTKLDAKGNFESGFDGISSGFPDTGFEQVSATVIQNDGKIIVGGWFSSYQGDASSPDNLIRLNSDGTKDSSFSGLTTGFDFSVLSLALQGDGKILVGGNFTSYNGNTSVPDRLIRLNSDGSVDSTFSGLNTGFDGFVAAITVQSDGKILVGGGFTSHNGSAAAPDMFVRLNSDGSLDPTFTGNITGFEYYVYAIELQTDGKILVGGWFSSYNGDSSISYGLVRLTSSGFIDGSFSTNNVSLCSGGAESFQIQPDGKLVVGAGGCVFRLNTDGTSDSSFAWVTDAFNASVRSVRLQSTGKILVGGEFTSFNGNDAVPDSLLRLNADGSIDPTFMGQIH